MGLIARRFGWLNFIFPPAAPNPINPSFVDDGIALVHQVLSGTERLDEIVTVATTGAAGIRIVSSPAVPAKKFRYVFACHMTHNDGSLRNSIISINSFPVVAPVAISALAQVPQNDVFPALRPFLVGPGQSIRYETTLIGGANVIVGHEMFVEYEIGEPFPRL